MLSLLMALVLAGEEPRIIEIQRDPIGLYDAEGVLQRKVARKSLSLPLPVSAIVDGMARIKVDDTTAYVRGADVVIAGKPPVCGAMARGPQKASETIAGAAIGVSSNMANVSVPCVPTAR